MFSKTGDKADQIKSLLKAIVDVFIPSALGVAIYTVIYAVTALANQPSQYKDTWHTVYLDDLHHSFIYRYAGDLDNLVRTQAANTVALYLFWGVIGLAIFALGVRLTNNFNELAEDLTIRNYIWPKGADRNSALKGFVERLVYRIVVAIIFLVYLSKTLPWLGAKWQSDTSGLNLSAVTLKHYLALLVYEFIVIHLTVVILRFLFLRRRLIEY
jgi:hypothetical protein